MTVKYLKKGGVEIDLRGLLILTENAAAITIGEEEGVTAEQRIPVLIIGGDIYGHYNMKFWDKIKRCWFLIKYTFKTAKSYGLDNLQRESAGGSK